MLISPVTRRALRLIAGFTLIELMVGIAILAIALAMGLPSFSNYLANARLRAAASNFHAAAQFARTEAIKRNGNVELVLTSANPVASEAGTTAITTAGTTWNWMVRERQLGASAPAPVFLQGKAGQEGGTGAAVVIAAAASAPASAGVIRFDGLGATGAGHRVLFLGDAASANCANNSGIGTIRCLAVQVSPSGQTRLCDPGIDPGSTTSTDSRACN